MQINPTHQKLTQKELLLILIERVESLEKSIGGVKGEVNSLERETVNPLKRRVGDLERSYSVAKGIVIGLGILGVSNLLVNVIQGFAPAINRFVGGC